MKNLHHRTVGKSAGLLITAVTMLSLQNAVAAIGEFEANSDVGNPTKAGSATYDPATDTYKVSGGGNNIWFDKDELHYVWRKIKGDFILQTSAPPGAPTANIWPSSAIREESTD